MGLSVGLLRRPVYERAERAAQSESREMNEDLEEMIERHDGHVVKMGSSETIHYSVVTAGSHHVNKGQLISHAFLEDCVEAKGLQAHGFESCPRSECKLGFLILGNGFLAGILTSHAIHDLGRFHIHKIVGMTEDLDMLSPEQQLALLNASGHLPKPWEPVSPQQHTYIGIYLIIVAGRGEKAEACNISASEKR
ncbi:hypothetical protein E2C01_023647 [Portunus trituberculatus]|uniref:Uncharacterized protein n=1 Tax=Portunus trituberculatus TaxID=210409 RepID=A0A5B7E8S0_PORTR|nr:hypothetical protein [Portunus trituberculatus]